MKFDIFGRGRTLRMAVTFTCEISFIFFGYDQGLFGGIIGNENFLQAVGNPGDSVTGIMLSIYNLGCCAGCLLNFLYGDYFGRRRVMWIAMAWILVGAALQTSCFSLAHLMVGRFICGIGTGIETSTVPMYQAEMCEASKRGRLVCSEVIFIGLGLVVSYFFDYGMSSVDGSLSWRLPVGCQMIFALIVIAMVFGLPESPRYLYSKGRNDEAIRVLCDVYDKEVDDEKILREQTDILDALQLETNANEYSFRKIFKKDEVQTGKRVLLAYGMQFMNQAGGINLVVYYVPTVLENNVGLTRDLSLILSGCIQCMFFLGAFVPSFFVDRLGRRKPMMWGSFGLGISMMMISILLSFKGTSIEHPAASASVAFFFTFTLIYSASASAIPWCYVPEILPLHARAKGTAIGVSSNWLWNFVIVMITPVIISRLQWKAYLIFMCTNLAFVPLVYFCYPETSNLTLEEIDLLYREHGTSARIVADRYQKGIKARRNGVVEVDIERKAVEGVQPEVFHDEGKSI
ncbi:hypothetical protein ASPWEDRAFT_27321 [Aspergillus wentii DTO 134E9]|uniref:Major facilitator superfamily (MFS) profile domain-containing protein n=1 Tax=Aspergillus wentii DTO 134E9 TaxID=1073089 RepID=A0A1L9RSQ2_ASPWE|nr:uncharacterized protein ASPWEDRAFT_27321 [Aspergillus wentii DTO 134E9]OJJ38006.1 hypothetical protein ASPWEDRAFT_27321 [Aspergillus wentii DTO 134E9]